MKKILLITFVFILSAFIAFPQWYWQNPLPQGNTLNSVKFISSTVGWAVGDAGTILYTSDGGTTWATQSSGTTNDLMAVTFIDANNGWIVGWYGTILKTTDGGSTWNPQTSGVSKYLLSVSFTDLNNGTAVGQNGTIIRTTNGGTNWTPQTSGTINICGVYLLLMQIQV